VTGPFEYQIPVSEINLRLLNQDKNQLKIDYLLFIENVQIFLPKKSLRWFEDIQQQN